jgi:hypothetical protein
MNTPRMSRRAPARITKSTRKREELPEIAMSHGDSSFRKGEGAEFIPLE